MPLYKSGSDMYIKYEKKYNPTVIGTRFGDVADVAKSRAQAGLNAVATIREMVRDKLDAEGITGGMRATYLAFALKLWKHTLRQGGESKVKIKDGLKSYFVTAYGLDATLLEEIGSAIIAGAGAGT